MDEPLIIIGAGGEAVSILDTVEAINARGKRWTVVGFLDDRWGNDRDFCGFPVFGPVARAYEFDGARFIIALGSDMMFVERSIIAASVRSDDFASVIHPAASISRRATLGNGVWIGAGAIVGTSSVVGNHVLVGAGATLAQGCVIDDCSVIGALAAIGNAVHVGANCFIGPSAVIEQHLTIGRETRVSTGSIVTESVPPRSLVRPARGSVIERRN
jgi:sugar O-acyltransferase (sialic acid O-acetyltransferase NeuD family)